MVVTDILRASPRENSGPRVGNCILWSKLNYFFMAPHLGGRKKKPKRNTARLFGTLYEIMGVNILYTWSSSP